MDKRKKQTSIAYIICIENGNVDGYRECLGFFFQKNLVPELTK